MTPAAESNMRDFGLPITPAQRQAMFAAARARGLEIDDIRAMTPAGSISKLTRLQAAEVLGRINAGTPHAAHRRPRRPKGVYALVSDAQRNKIEVLRLELGWTREGLSEWLEERTHTDGRRMTRMDTTADASAVIELLKQVLKRTAASRRRRAGVAAPATSAPPIGEPVMEGRDDLSGPSPARPQNSRDDATPGLVESFTSPVRANDPAVK